MAPALSFRSGLRNTMLQLVEYDCDMMKEWISIIEPTAEEAREYFSRANHALYERTTNSSIGITFQDIIKETFMIKLQSFSGVDRTVTFHDNISKNSFQPSEDAQKEIDAFMKGDRLQHPRKNAEENLNAIKRKDIINGDKGKGIDDYILENDHKYSTQGHKREFIVNYNDTKSDDSTDDESYSTDFSEESDDDKYISDTKNYHYKRIWHCSPPTSDVYHDSNFMSKIKVYKQQELGYAAPLADKKKNATNQSSRNVSI